MSATHTLSRRQFAFTFAALAIASTVQAQEPRLYLSDRFSETADPAADVRRAVEIAGGRRILLDVGGDWCPWCRMLDRAIQTNPSVREAFAAAFLIVKVHYSRAHPNEAFLSRYPDVAGYPHFFVLDRQGRFIASQPTEFFEAGRGYNTDKLINFARMWTTR